MQDMAMEKIVYECIYCGYTLDEDEYSDEAMVFHVLERHQDLLIGLANGLFRAKRVGTDTAIPSTQD